MCTQIHNSRIKISDFVPCFKLKGNANKFHVILSCEECDMLKTIDYGISEIHNDKNNHKSCV